jgi:hypothetical protein
MRPGRTFDESCCLGEFGCSDALVGVGQPGRIALDFTREGPSAQAAITSALADVKKAIPDGKLVEVSPDLVGLTDVAELVGVTRQNVRKLMLSHAEDFPAPVRDGSAILPARRKTAGSRLRAQRSAPSAFA